MAKCPLLRQLDGSIRDDVAEVFCPPRFVPMAKQLGMRASLSVDWLTGYDLRLPEVRRQILIDIEARRPRLVITCAPCTMFPL